MNGEKLYKVDQKFYINMLNCRSMANKALGKNCRTLAAQGYLKPDRAYAPFAEKVHQKQTCCKQVYGMAHTHKLTTFTRFEMYPEMLLVADIEEAPKYAIDDALAFHCQRFPTFVIAFYMKPFVFAKSWRKDVVIGKISNKEFDSFKDAISFLREEIGKQVGERFEIPVKWDESVYEKFYDSQFIESRKNLKLQRQRLHPFFLGKNSYEEKAIKKFRMNKPNTSLKQFCQDC